MRTVGAHVAIGGRRVNNRIMCIRVAVDTAGCLESMLADHRGARVRVQARLEPCSLSLSDELDRSVLSSDVAAFRETSEWGVS